jgi:hypothetical protein
VRAFGEAGKLKKSDHIEPKDHTHKRVGVGLSLRVGVGVYMNGQQQEPKLPQIDPVTFAALNTLDMFIARAPLTRAEHVEANKSLQHLVQTLEMLQGAVRQMNGARATYGPLTGNGQPANGSATAGKAEGTESRVVAEIAQEIFRNAEG